MKPDEKELMKIKQEGQKPTMETQGPPPPPTSQYYLHHPSYMSPAPFGFDPSHPMYRNMIVPGTPYNPSPYHLQMPRYHPPEDLSRNPNTKALDLLQHHASQYYNTHKIHELSERALKSPTSNVKMSVSSPNVGSQQQQNTNPNSNVGGIGGSGGPGQGGSGGNGGGGGGVGGSSVGSGGGMSQQNQPPQSGGLSLPLPSQSQPSSTVQPPSTGGNVGGVGGLGGGGGERGVSLNPSSKSGNDKTGPTGDPLKDGQNNGRSPPPQRHVHTHHHTHVGLTYPMYPAPYQGI